MSGLPIRRQQFRMADFAGWLAANGAEVCIPTNAYEVIRYRAFWNGSAKAVTHIVYTKDSGLLTFTGGSQAHYRSFLADAPLLGNQPPFVSQFDAPPPAQAASQGQPEESLSARRRKRLLARDGDGCWFCGEPLGSDSTLEHLVPKSRGGGNDSANLVLAHAGCNNAAANLSISEKVALRENMRAHAMQEGGSDAC